MSVFLQSSERSVQELRALCEISRTLSSSLDLHASAAGVLETLGAMLGMNRGTITLLDPAGQDLAIQVSHGLTPEEHERGRFRIGEGITGTVFETGEPIVVSDLQADPRFVNKTGARIAPAGQKLSFLAVPITVHGETLGVLGVDRLFPEGMDSVDEDLRVLTKERIQADVPDMQITDEQPVEIGDPSTGSTGSPQASSGQAISLHFPAERLRWE